MRVLCIDRIISGCSEEHVFTNHNARYSLGSKLARKIKDPGKREFFRSLIGGKSGFLLVGTVSTTILDLSETILTVA